MHLTSLSANPPRSRIPLAYAAGDCTVIAAYGRIDSTGLLGLERLAAVALDSGCTHLVFDLHEVHDVDAEALDLLRAALRSNRLDGVTVAVAGARPGVALALEELGSEGISIHANVRAALVPAVVRAGR